MALLRREGLRVLYPRGQTFHGRPAWNSGYRYAARHPRSSPTAEVIDPVVILGAGLAAHVLQDRHVRLMQAGARRRHRRPVDARRRRLNLPLAHGQQISDQHVGHRFRMGPAVNVLRVTARLPLKVVGFFIALFDIPPGLQAGGMSKPWVAGRLGQPIPGCYSKKVIPIIPGACMNHIVKITAKGQTTIPQDVRAALHVSPGDYVAWEMAEDGTARVRRVQPLDLDYLRSLEGTLTEWSSDADEAAYHDL